MEGAVLKLEAVELKKDKREEPNIWKRGRFYWIQYYDQHGRQVKESSRSETLQVARRLLKRRQGEKEAGLLSDPAAKRYKVQDLADAFLRYYQDKKSLRWAKGCCNNLMPVFGAMRAAHVTTDDIAKYIEKRKGNEVSNATINRELACLHKMFTLGRKCTPPKVQEVPIFPDRLKEADPRKGFVKDEQYRQFCENCKEPWLRAFLAVAYNYGFRRGELLSLRVRQVDLFDRTIDLEPGTTKNGEGRKVKMTEEVYRNLCECVRAKSPDDFVFTWGDGRPVRDFRGQWANVIEAAGLPGQLVHDLRRSAVRNMIRCGIPEVVAMKISGHKTRSVFDRYNIVAEDDLEDAALLIEQGRARRAQVRDTNESRDKIGTKDVVPAGVPC
jgi:integrase